MPGFLPLLLLDRIHYLSYWAGERVDLHRAALALGLALTGIYPVTLPEVAHGDTDLWLTEIGAPLDVARCRFIGICEIYKHLCNISLDADTYKELGEFLIAWRKIPYFI